ncbi:MAG TPA: helix-hairpin-helix domain-containing protein [Candidatus Kapabacteria bacterium]|nr:helix-hairpin-helix domain-containing protein [Candidatus Kapabacteria bacterium]
MSAVTEILRKIRERSRGIAGKFFTPNEYKAALIFLGLGVAALLYRGGKIIIRAYFPSSQSAITQLTEHKNDSIFAYLSSKTAERDSLDESLSEDSINKRLAEKSSSKSGKEKSLSEHSIAINSADSITFQRLPAVGVVTARRIVAYRTSRGKFRNVKELMNVEGIGEGKFKKMEPYLRLD